MNSILLIPSKKKILFNFSLAFLAFSVSCFLFYHGPLLKYFFIILSCFVVIFLMALISGKKSLNITNEAIYYSTFFSKTKILWTDIEKVRIGLQFNPIHFWGLKIATQKTTYTFDFMVFNEINIRYLIYLFNKKHLFDYNIPGPLKKKLPPLTEEEINKFKITWNV